METERLLDDEGNCGTENVLDTADTYDSCESGSSRLYSAGMGAGCARLRFSRGRRRQRRRFRAGGRETYVPSSLTWGNGNPAGYEGRTPACGIQFSGYSGADRVLEGQ